MRRARRRWRIATLLVAALIAALTVSIVVRRSVDDEPQSTTEEFQFPADYEGPVWVQVGDSAETLDLELDWGAWGADWPIGPDDARSYWFAKQAIAEGEPNPPLIVTVTPETRVHIGFGQMPAGTEATPGDAWYPIDESAE